VCQKRRKDKTPNLKKVELIFFFFEKCWRWTIMLHFLAISLLNLRHRSKRSSFFISSTPYSFIFSTFLSVFLTKFGLFWFGLFLSFGFFHSAFFPFRLFSVLPFYPQPKIFNIKLQNFPLSNPPCTIHPF
jgi:hypothetical protein